MRWSVEVVKRKREGEGEWDRCRAGERKEISMSGR